MFLFSALKDGNHDSHLLGPEGQVLFVLYLFLLYSSGGFSCFDYSWTQSAVSAFETRLRSVLQPCCVSWSRHGRFHFL